MAVEFHVDGPRDREADKWHHLANLWHFAGHLDRVLQRSRAATAHRRVNLVFDNFGLMAKSDNWLQPFMESRFAGPFEARGLDWCGDSTGGTWGLSSGVPIL